MQVKPSKCGLLEHLPPLRFGRPLNQISRPILNTFKINNVSIPIIDSNPNSKYKYLGVLRGKLVRQNPLMIYKKCMTKLHQIVNSPLLPWQALDAIKTFIHPKLIFHYRNYHTSAAFIRANSITVSEGERRGLDYIYIQAIRKLLGHSNSASIDYLYSPIDLGGVGCVSAWDETKSKAWYKL